ncbi:MAG TPA: glycoside hydrolase domain-containing protein [Chitinophagaceae bacterium]|nr:glycoside hydrolase domain-containing protein [Chitinophagaceae bacterium]
MKYATRIFCLYILFPAFAFSQSYKGQVDFSKIPFPAQHYQEEYNFDATLNVSAWTTQQKGLHVSFGSEDKLYFRAEVPEIKNETTSWETTGWRGERLNAQIVVWSSDTLEQVHFKVSDLKNEKEKLLSKDNIQLNKVCYVLANFPYGSNEPNCGESPYKNGFLFPDRFEAFDRFDVPGKTVRPVWISLNIPADAEPGTYNGYIEVNSKSEHAVLNVKIKVQNQILPKPHDWKYRYDLWQNPWVIADYYHLKPWSEEHKALLKKHLKLYADAGGTYITTYGVHSPWSDNEYAIEGGMIEWIKHKDGSWKFDYNIFDQYIELAMSVGIDKAITIYTPVPNNNRFRYMDEKTGNYVYESWPPQSDTFKTAWNIFLNDLKTHLEKKGWFEKTYIGINESELSQTLAAIKVVKENSRKWKITYAGDWHKELDTLLDDYCCVYENQPAVNDIKARSAKGFTSTYYVCCHPAKPNTFIFSPPIEGRWISWYSAAKGYNGFLRWAYDAWPEDPMRDARFGSWAAGDCYLVYPGGNSCIRFEKLREGIVDFEKIRILREKASGSTDKAVKDLMTQLDDHLQLFLTEKDFNTEKIKKDVDKGGKILDELSDKLSIK